MQSNQIAALVSFVNGRKESNRDAGNLDTQQSFNTPASTTSSDALEGATPIVPAPRSENRFPCPYEGCDRMLTCPHNVSQHIREKHTHERPYGCIICQRNGTSASYARPGTLYRHMRLIHKIEPNIKNGRPRTKTLGRRSPASAAPAKQINAQNKSRAAMQNTAVNHSGLVTAPTSTSITPVLPPVVFQPQPQRPFTPVRLEQRLAEQQGCSQQEHQLEIESYRMPQQADNMGYAAPVDPAPTPGPERDARQQDSNRAQSGFDQGYFGIIDYSQFAFGVDTGVSYHDGIGQLPDNLDDLFADLEKGA